MPFVLQKAFNLPALSTRLWQIRGTLISITSIEYVTKTQVKFDISAAIRGEAVTLQTAKEELNSLAEDWGKPEWTELDWTKVKDLSFQEIYEARKQQIAKAEDATCISCPGFAKHVRYRHLFDLRIC
jgi:antiviral helicase SKI2